jgi:hypothetical protein
MKAVASFSYPLSVSLLLLAVTTTHAATLLVYNNNDTGAGSLRQAIADNRALGGGHTIIFSNIVTGTITLTASELLVTNNVIIQGPGAKILSLSGNNSHRVFSISNAIVSISGLTITLGRTNFPGGGAILLTGGSLSLNDSSVINSTSLNQGVGGGAIAAVSAASLFITNCSFSGNSVSPFTGFANGGAIYASGLLAIVNSSVMTNSGSFEGGGVQCDPGCSATFINSTFYGNSAGFAGGGVALRGTSTITSCTFSRNIANGPPPYGGGGIFNAGTCTIQNTIVARNTNTYTNTWDVAGPFTSGGYNLIGAINGSGGWGTIGDQSGFTSSPINPLLDVPAANGGPTYTVRPLPGSPAIDQGKSFGLLTDQRGRTRPFDNPNPNAPAGDGSDIGAFEISPATLLVTNTNDTGAGSLRQTVLDASSFESDIIQFAPNVLGVIRFTNGVLGIDKSLSIRGPGASLLTLDGRNSDQLFVLLSGNIAVSGFTIANGRYQGTSGNPEQDGFQARGGGIFNQATLALSDCILSNNAAIGGAGGTTTVGFGGNGGNGRGGAIENIGTLFMTNCFLVSNSAVGGAGGLATEGGSDGGGGQGYGGGIYSVAPITIVRCTLANNSAVGGVSTSSAGSGSGGGLNSEGAATILNSTIVTNQAAGSPFDFGGGIYDNGTSLLVRSCTIVGNQADYGGGLSTSAVDLGNSILAGNSATSGPDCAGSVNSTDYNLIQNTNATTFSGITLHNIIGQDPLLGPLQDNGGLSPSMALLLNSPAIDKGKSFGLFVDQRNAQRPFDFASIANAGGGDGSDIGAFELGRPSLAIAKVQSSVVLSWPSLYGPFRVESVGDIIASNSWTTVPGTPVVNGSQYVLTNGPISGTKFFRLNSP